jgi:drug/metabolite transporter (DMT)-like permease
VLIYSYSVSDFSVAYPLARGISPLFTALLGIFFLDDSLGALTLIGIAVVSVGIVSVARGKSINPYGFAAAVVTGLLTTTYSLVDAKGVRLAPNALTFIAWFYLADSVSMPLILLSREKGNTVVALAAEVRTGIFAGIMTFFSFVPALLAFRLAPAGTVAAIRETSVIIGLALSVTFLKEIVDARRLAGAMLVTTGTLAIIAGTG